MRQSLMLASIAVMLVVLLAPHSVNIDAAPKAEGKSGKAGTPAKEPEPEFCPAWAATARHAPRIYSEKQIDALPLETAHVECANGTPAVLEALKRLSNLQQLTILRDSDCTDESLQALAKLTTLKTLTLNHCDITGAGIRHLTSLANLEALDLSGSPAAAAGGLVVLQQFKNLHTLKLIGQSDIENPLIIDGAGLAHIAKVSTLTHLDLNASIDLSSSNIVESFAALAKLKLVHLDVIGCDGDFKEAGKAAGGKSSVLTEIGKMKTLETLWVGMDAANDPALLPLGKLANLKRLTLSMSVSALSPKALGFLSTMRKLEYLYIEQRDSANVAWLGALGSARAVKELHPVVTVTDATLNIIGGMTSLEKLILRYDAPLGPLGKLTNLRELELLPAWENLDDGDLTPLQQLAKLERLKINAGCPPKAVASLAKLKNLRSLDIRCEPEDVNGVLAALAGASCIELTLRVNAVRNRQRDRNEPVPALADFSPLISLPRLRSLVLDDCDNIDTPSFESLKKVKQLTSFAMACPRFMCQVI